MISVWENCYSDSWKGIITPESFAHPAKMARGLLQRIVERFFNEGWLKPDDVVGDPFGGIGTTGIICSYAGLRSVSVELEPRFVELAKKNFVIHARKIGKHFDPSPVILQGDSRNFASLVGECQAIVTSPPYAETRTLGGEEAAQVPIGKRKHQKHCGVVEDVNVGYGTHPGQIGSLPGGSLDAAITSPPYNKPFSQDHNGKRGGKRSNGTAPSSERGAFVTYGTSEGQIEGVTPDTYWSAMKQVYAQMHLAMRPGAVAAIVVKDFVRKGQRVPLCDQTVTLLSSLGFDVFERTRAMLVKEKAYAGLFGEHVERKERKSFFRRLAEKKGSPRIDWEEVIWARKIGSGGMLDGCVTSPPWSDVQDHDTKENYERHGCGRLGKSVGESYGNTPGNIGNLRAGHPPIG